jgi:hypothetical protein
MVLVLGSSSLLQVGYPVFHSHNEQCIALMMDDQPIVCWLCAQIHLGNCKKIELVFYFEAMVLYG